MISVCIATYNGGKYIELQLQSILSQLGELDEVVISDDGSTDSTINLINRFRDSRIKLYHNKNHSTSKRFKFHNTSLNFENALLCSKGDIIFLADQDDIWERNKVEIVLKKLDDYEIIAHDCSIIDNDYNILHESYFSLISAKSGILNNILKSSFLGCCMAFRRDILKNALPLPTDPIPHDIWIGLIGLSKYKLCFLHDRLLKYRRHDSNLSASSSKSNYSIFNRFFYRYYIIKSLIIRVFIRR